MLAYCDTNEGHIHFGNERPRGTVLIAKHPNQQALRDAIMDSGALHAVEHQGRKVTFDGLAVPWVGTAKYRDEAEQRIGTFAAKVRERLWQSKPPARQKGSRPVIPESERDWHTMRHPIGHDSRYWSKGRRHLTVMLNAIERLSPHGELFTKTDLRDACDAAMPAIYDLLAKLQDYGHVGVIQTEELRSNARDVCPAPARYWLKPGADLSRFREIANAYDHSRA